LGLFLLFENQRDLFTRAEVYNLKRMHEFSAIRLLRVEPQRRESQLLEIDRRFHGPEVNRLADRRRCIALHDDGQVNPFSST